MFDTTLSSITDFAYTFDRTGRFVYANRPLLALWGLKLDEIIGKSFSELPYQEELATKLQSQIQQVLTTGKMITDETQYTSPGGAIGYYEYIFNPIAGADGTIEVIAGSTRDVTERKLAEVALLKSEKLAAAGRLAATLAHEINNPLQAVTNLLSILKQSSRMEAEDQAYVVMADEELSRVTHLTQQSLGFYRESIFPTTVNLEEVLDSIFNLYAKRMNAKNIVITKQYLSDNATINSYPGEIRQVFSTLLVNASTLLIYPLQGH
jgi:PAS domain S-box-containing protein